MWIDEGEQLPVDGTLESENALIDTALLTGEDQPRKHTIGDHLYAGTINAGPAIVLKVTHLAHESRIAQIDHIAKVAESEKAEIPRLADRIAQYFLPGILLIALGPGIV